jgi:multicomponent Na+:H+ antiporter subunit D
MRIIMISVPPAAIFIAGAFLIPFLKGRLKSTYMLLIPTLAFMSLLSMSEGSSWVFSFLDYDLIFCRVDRLSMLFGYIFVIIAFIGNLFALHVKRVQECMAATFYAGGALGVVFAGDYLSLFVFWEIMAFSAVFLIWYRGTKEAIDAGFRYILVHVVSGLCLLGGIVIHVVNTGSIEFSFLGLDGIASYFVFLGFIINAAAIPFHRWLPDAYPEATVTGAVFLSAFTTKSAVYVLARAFPGTEILIWIGAIMTVYPIFYAVLENDIRRVLGYSLINQVGFMLCGIGIGTELAINGATSHAFCHILYKALLFMSTGSVLYMTGKIRCTDLGGLYKTMPLTAICCIIAAASISAFPFFSGFVSKSMVVTASAIGHMSVIWFMLQFASAGVFHHAGIKVPFFTFFAHDSGIRTRDPPLHMLLAMGITAFLCIFIGVFPGPLYSILPYPVDYVPYTAFHVVSQFQLLLFAALAFTLLILSGYYPPELRAINLDTDWFYRKGARAVLWFINNPLAQFGKMTERIFFDYAPNSVVKFVTLWGAFDLNIIDGVVNAISRVTVWFSDTIRKVQTGDVQSYATISILSLTILLIILFWGV